MSESEVDDNQSHPREYNLIHAMRKNLPLILVSGVVSVFLVNWGYYMGSQSVRDTNFTRVKPTAQITQPSPMPPVDSRLQYVLYNSCSGQECLFEGPEAIEGFARLRGYYKTYDAAPWGETVTCNSLLVTGGSEMLTAWFKQHIIEGNSINQFDEDNNLLLTINMEGLSLENKQKVLSSTKNNQIELGVIRATPKGRGAPACFSFVEIVSVASVK